MHNSPIQTKNTDKLDAQDFSLTPAQQEAYNAISKHKSLFISGAAGCGKSVVITERMKSDVSGNLLLCATTNQACRILSEKLNTGANVPTLQSVLDMKPVYDGSTKNPDNLMDFFFSTPASEFTSLKGIHLIVDEASMICKNTQLYLLELLKREYLSSVTFVGDIYQLPCVKKEAMDYDLIDQVIELTQVKRADGKLLEYYNQIRKDVIADDPITIPVDVKHFDQLDEFASYMNNVNGSRCVISWTNAAADTFSKMMDSEELYEGQECTALAHCSYRHLEDDKEVSFTTNSNIIIEKLFTSYFTMKHDSIKTDYMYELPKKPVNLDLNAVRYAKVRNEDGETVYIAIWTTTNKEKETLYLNKMTRIYRKFLDSVRPRVPKYIWDKYSKDDGYPKSLRNIKKQVHLPREVIMEDTVFWNDFFAVNEAVPLRSIFSTTAHRVQGTTVDVAGVNWTNISKCRDKRLQYVSLTRAAKELVIYTGAENEAV